MTIMLNYVAFYLVFYALSEQSLLQAPSSANPKSLPMKESAVLPKLLGDRYNLHLGFLLALRRGGRRVVDPQPVLPRLPDPCRGREPLRGPRSAGIDVGRTYIVVMLISGALVGLAGVNQVLGTVTAGITIDLDAGIGFDAITVALLGRSRPIGILWAGLLFGAFKAGGFAMQASQGIPVDIVLVVQSLIVLFIAAPPLDPGDLPTACEGGPMSDQASTHVTTPAAAEEIRLPEVTVVDRKAPTMFAILTVALALIVAFARRGRRHDVPPGRRQRLRRAARDHGAVDRHGLGPRPGLRPVHRRRGRALHRRRKNTTLWLVVLFAFAWMTGFLTWAAAGSTVPVVGLLGGSLAVAVPLVFGALGGVLGERAGVVNIAIDGQLLFGAFAAAMVGSLVGSTWAGLGAAMVAGLLVAAVLAVFAINYLVDQVIVGVVLNVLVIGITSFMFSQVLAPNAATLNHPPRFQRFPIPVLGDIPLIGPIFFRQTVIVYLLYIAVALVTWALYRTKWGLRVRAVGEHPKAADTVGIKVNRTRFRTVLLAGAIAGMGGAFYTLVSVPQFNREMTGGAGYIALAAVIFGKWDPVRATLAALLLRLRLEPPGRAVGHRLAGAQPVHADAAVRRHDLRRGRPRRPLPATRRRRHPVPGRRPLAADTDRLRR